MNTGDDDVERELETVHDLRSGGPTPPRESDLYIELLKKCLAASIYDESAWWKIQFPKNSDLHTFNIFKSIPAIIKRGILRSLRKRSYLLMRQKPFNASDRDQGLDWPCFGYTMVGRRRLDNVQYCIEDVLAHQVPGDLIETGVWRGGTTILMRAVLKLNGATDRVVWCADSFEGLPVPTETDRRSQDDCDFSDRDYLSVSLEQVKANFDRFGLLDDQVKFLKGWFSETLPTAPIDQIAILRMDGDLYSSTMDALTNLYPKMSDGGYVIVDDYHSWPACRRAVDEYRAEHGITADLVDIDPHSVYWRVAGDL